MNTMQIIYKFIGKRQILSALLAWLLIGSNAMAATTITVPQKVEVKPVINTPNCEHVRLADVGWTDLAATIALSEVVLNAIGYSTEVIFADNSVDQAFEFLKDNKADIFLGAWMPTATRLIKPYGHRGFIEVLARNLDGAIYNLATNRFGAEAGLRSYEDIYKFKNELDGKIYGIEAGNDGNNLIKLMIARNAYNLKDFTLVESDEAGMLAAQQRLTAANKMFVSLAWRPHPMNLQRKLTYLRDNDDIFGENGGAAEVYTVTRGGFSKQCDNLASLFRNLKFTTDMEAQIMDDIINHKLPARQAATKWLRANGATLTEWLIDIDSVDGDEALSVARQKLNIN